VFIYLYNQASETGLAIAEALGIRRIRHEGSTFRGSLDKIVLNWGSAELPREVRKCYVVNTETGVMNAVDKVRAFRIMDHAGVRVVPYTTSVDMAHAWKEEGHTVFARTRVAGHDGEGVEVVRHDQPLPHARLYTKYIPSEREYRITCSIEGIIGMQRKVRLAVAPEGGYNDMVRTSGGGYGFKFVTRGVPPSVMNSAMAAVSALGLDFGGVDVLWDGQAAYVLEVNTAPQLTPRLLTAFCTWIRSNFLDGNEQQEE